MSDVQNKTAPEAATSETESVVDNKQSTATIVAETAEKIKAVYQPSGCVSRIIETTGDISSMSLLVGGLSTVMSIQELNGLFLVFHRGIPLYLTVPTLRLSWCDIYGAVIIMATDGNKPVSMTPEQVQAARAWLLRHSV